jgi:C4-dicarboxylate transporter
MSKPREIKKRKNKTNKDDGTGQTAVALAKVNAKIKLAEYNHLTQVSNNEAKIKLAEYTYLTQVSKDEVKITQINANKELGSQQRRTESMFLYFVKCVKTIKIIVWLAEHWESLVKISIMFTCVLGCVNVR